MLRLYAHATVRRCSVRSLATTPPPLKNPPTDNPTPDDNPVLDFLLNTDEGLRSSLPKLDQEQNDNLHLPQPPPGSLPPPGPPASGSARRLDNLDNTLPVTRTYHLHVSSSRNNTILTLTDAVGNPRAWVSSGLCGFKKVQRSGYEAGYQCAVKMFQKIAEQRATEPSLRLEILFKGFGFGREALYRALMTTEGERIRDAVDRLTDVTPLKIGGTRAKKARRL